MSARTTWRRSDNDVYESGFWGRGLMGGKLGTLFARAGHDVIFSYARGEQKLKRLAREAKGNAQAD
ncbi:MAG TPA: NAD(P)-binding domain-containing protein [Vicinamibacterales bacterium]|nr:NAD(P)-binding domain-containing protein [Vicinamibacterales bacterium]